MKGSSLLGWSVAFFVAAILVAMVAFAAALTTLGAMSKVLFWIFLVGSAVSLALYFSRSRA